MIYQIFNNLNKCFVFAFKKKKNKIQKFYLIKKSLKNINTQ